MRTPIPSPAAAGVLLLLAASAAQAQLAVTAIGIDPAAPVDGDMVAFTVTVQAPGSCFSDPTQVMIGEIVGNAAQLALPPCQDTGLPNDASFTFQAQLGQFFAGTYTIQVFRNADFPTGTPVATETMPVGQSSNSGGSSGEGNGYGLCGPDPCYRAETNACPTVKYPEPCNLILDITNAINGAPTTSYWQWWLDTPLSSWTYQANGSIGSQNKPVMSAAIALWVSPSGISPPVLDKHGQTFDAYQWWSNFLGCQTGSSYCPNVAGNTTQQYFNGAEILSAAYGGYVTLSVAAVALWAQKHPALDTLGVGSQAEHFLQITVSLWALGAGPSWASSLTYVASPGAAPEPISCDAQSFQLPFLAVAGARGVVNIDPCHDDRGPIFASAIGFSVGVCQQPTWNNRLQEAIQCAWTPDSSGTNVWGVSAANRQHLQGFIGVPAYQTIVQEGDYNTANTLVSIPLKGVRFIDEYHFVSWKGERASILYKNPNTNTVSIFAIDYRTASGSGGGGAVTALYPWVYPRTNSTPGYAELLGSTLNRDGTPVNPSGAQASNCYPNGTGCGPENPPQIQTMTLNKNKASAVLYMIKLSPTADASFDH